MAKEEMGSLFTTRGEIPLELDYAQTYGMGASGAAMLNAAPQWIHHGCLTDLTRLGTEVTQTYRRETARDLRIAESWSPVNDDSSEIPETRQL